MIVRANIVCNDGSISPTCQDCHRGCCSHHGGCSSNPGSSSSNSGNTTNNNSLQNSNSSNNIEQPVVEEVKSSDATLKEVIVDKKKIEIANNMFYTTKKEVVSINVIANSDKANVNYDEKPQLDIGKNILNIKVTAENGNVKTYKLNITREKILSNNKNIKIKVNGNDVNFNDFKSDIIYIPYNENKVNIEYVLEDKNAQVEIGNNNNLIVGHNEIIVKVTAENGSEQNYILVVERNAKQEENIPISNDNKEPENNSLINDNDEQDDNDTNPIIPLALFGGAGYGIYKFSKRKK